MIQIKNSSRASGTFAYRSFLLAAALTATAVPAIFAQNRATETVDARAMGTGTQMGQNISVKVTIYRYSTQADRQVLVDAFKNGQSKGLVDALSKMKSVGRIAITGTLGTDLSYIALIPSPTGRKIRFATNRPIRFAEAYNAGPSMDYDLTVGEFDLNDSDQSKSGGTLYPASQLVINKRGQLQFELRRNAWKTCQHHRLEPGWLQGIEAIDTLLTPGHDVGDVFIQMCESGLASWMGMEASLCIFAKTCGDALALEHNGDLYSCEHFYRAKTGGDGYPPPVMRTQPQLVSKQTDGSPDRWCRGPACYPGPSP